MSSIAEILPNGKKLQMIEINGKKYFQQDNKLFVQLKVDPQNYSRFSPFLSVVQNGTYLCKLQALVTYFEINPVFAVLQELENTYSTRMVEAADLQLELSQKYKKIDFQLADNKLLKHQGEFVKFDAETVKQFAKQKYNLLVFKTNSHEQAIEFLSLFFNNQQLSSYFQAEIQKNHEKTSSAQESSGFGHKAKKPEANKPKVGALDRFLKPKPK